MPSFEPPIKARVGGAASASGAAETVLLAVSGCEHPSFAALQRTAALANALSACVQVVRVLAPSPGNGKRPEGASIEPDELAAVQAAQSVTRARLGTILGAHSPWHHHRVRLGAFVEQASLHAVMLRARHIVLSGEGRVGRTAAAIVKRSGASVLVARAPAQGDAVLACTDLRDDRYPVLQCGAALGVRLQLPVVALHNVQTMLPITGLAGGLIALPHMRQEAVHARRQQLVEATEQLGIPTRAVVMHEPDPVQAILAEARRVRADVIVAGTRPRSWLARTLWRSTAIDLTDEAPVSVLLTPVDERDRVSN